MKTNKLTIGILAHVDAGKTTLSESLLYETGHIRKQGRVDHKDAFLDTYDLEKNRGITIFAKQAVFSLGNYEITLLDTPGHVDFSAEMERTLRVLDYAVLVINGSDGVQGHTLTVWKLLKSYNVPAFIFVNKMDLVGTDRQALLLSLQKNLDDNCIDFTQEVSRSEALAMCDDPLMDQYVTSGIMTLPVIQKAIARRHTFPVYFGSALKNEGVGLFIEGLGKYMTSKAYPDIFGARVFKVTRSPQGERLTYVKVTGGVIKVKSQLTGTTDTGESWQEKVDQIRIYSGAAYEGVQQASAGEICALTGLTSARAGHGLGFESQGDSPVLTPVLNYGLTFPDSISSFNMLKNMRLLEEEEPNLNVLWNENLGEIHVQVMGEIQIEILKSTILERFGIEVDFEEGGLVYRETIKEPVIGRGHFEPLKHYAEVHLLMEPLERGQGMVYALDCSEDVLDKNWQHLVLTHLMERKHLGVLTGSQLTDMKVTLVTGRGHNKHTEGGDFRQATFRALRQGLMKAETVLLEPVYEYNLEIPKEFIGRALSDVERMQGKYNEPVIDDTTASISGTAPVATMMNYSSQVMAYTKGMGRLTVRMKGYEPCHNADEVSELIGYEPSLDVDNPTGSVFCSKGVGYTVTWDEADRHMHMESSLKQPSQEKEERASIPRPRMRSTHNYSDSELEEIFVKTYGAQKERRPGNNLVHRSTGNSTGRKARTGKEEEKEKYLLVDGYNIIFAWDELKDMAEEHMDTARQRLMDMLSDYQGQTGEKVILVFDAYRVAGNGGNMFSYHNIHVVYTKEAETADQYIERLVHEIRPSYEVTVATSDVVEQVIILGKGARKLSADGFKAELDNVRQFIEENYLQAQKDHKHRPFDDILKESDR